VGGRKGLGVGWLGGEVVAWWVAQEIEQRMESRRAFWSNVRSRNAGGA